MQLLVTHARSWLVAGVAVDATYIILIAVHFCGAYTAIACGPVCVFM